MSDYFERMQEKQNTLRKYLAREAITQTPTTWTSDSDAEHEMLVARAALRIAARIILGELELPDYYHNSQGIVDYCIATIRMGLHTYYTGED